MFGVPGDYVLNVSIDNADSDLGALVVSADELLANDSDPDGNSLTITSVGNAINGSVEMNDAGDILFKPGTDSPGSFDYTISDGMGAESTATVTINGTQVTGSDSNDVFVSTAENELFSGKDGNDTFSFAIRLREGDRLQRVVIMQGEEGKHGERRARGELEFPA